MSELTQALKEPALYIIVILWIAILLYMQKYYPFKKFLNDVKHGDPTGGDRYYIMPIIILVILFGIYKILFTS
jgi:hypothetical protein